jgi:hypothetical protein
VRTSHWRRLICGHLHFGQKPSGQFFILELNT